MCFVVTHSCTCDILQYYPTTSFVHVRVSFVWSIGNRILKPEYFILNKHLISIYVPLRLVSEQESWADTLNFTVY